MGFFKTTFVDIPACIASLQIALTLIPSNFHGQPLVRTSASGFLHAKTKPGFKSHTNHAVPHIKRLGIRIYGIVTLANEKYILENTEEKHPRWCMQRAMHSFRYKNTQPKCQQLTVFSL